MIDGFVFVSLMEIFHQIKDNHLFGICPETGDIALVRIRILRPETEMRYRYIKSRAYRMNSGYFSLDIHHEYLSASISNEESLVLVKLNGFDERQIKVTIIVMD